MTSAVDDRAAAAQREINVIHALAWYFPESTGGTEVYVSGLVKELPAFGIACAVAAARHGSESLDYVADGVAVHRYPYEEATDSAAIRGERPPRHFQAFVAWLERQPRGIYHQHSWATSCGFHHINAAKRLGFKTVLTLHIPGYICLRGTMMEFGRDPCDGRVDAQRCASCWSHDRGLSQRAAQRLSRVPGIISRVAYRSGAKSRIVTALGGREMAAVRRRQLSAMAAAADRIVAVCGWMGDALRVNGIGEDKVVLNRQGVDRDFVRSPTKQRQTGHKFRLGFLGRSDPVKGLSILIDAMALLPPGLELELAVHAIANTEHERRYRDLLVARTAADARIEFLPPVARADLAAVLAGFDALAVPSQWKETGPLVVLEALALGIPVLGSDLGGIAELVEPGVNGHLVAFSDAALWAGVIREAVAGTLPCMSRAGAGRPVRTMADAARDMSALYASIA